MGYKKISDYLNEQGIKTPKGNLWGGNNVHSVLNPQKNKVGCKNDKDLKNLNKKILEKRMIKLSLNLVTKGRNSKILTFHIIFLKLKLIYLLVLVYTILTNKKTTQYF